MYFYYVCIKKVNFRARSKPTSIEFYKWFITIYFYIFRFLKIKYLKTNYIFFIKINYRVQSESWKSYWKNLNDHKSTNMQEFFYIKLTKFDSVSIVASQSMYTKNNSSNGTLYSLILISINLILHYFFLHSYKAKKLSVK